MQNASTAKEGIPNVPGMVTPIQVKELQDKGTPIQFIDARSEEDWNSSPYELIGAMRYQKGEQLNSLPGNEMIVAYCSCPHDEASRQLAQELRNQNYNAYALQGGFKLWKELGLPLEEKANP